MSEQNESRAPASRLEGLEAYLLAQQEGPEAGLSRLTDISDPEVMRRRLAILLSFDRFEEAASLVRGREIHDRWYDKAILAFLKVGETAGAKKILDWAKAQNDILIRDRCIVIYVESQLSRIQQAHKGQEAVFPGRLTEAEKAQLLDAKDTLAPIIKRVLANERIQSEIESVAIQCACNIGVLLARYSEVRKLGELLLARYPCPLLVGQLAVSGVIPATADIANRLRSEHPDSFDANLLSTVLEGERLGQPEKAFDAGLALGKLARTEDDRRNVVKLLHQLSHHLGPERLKEVESAAVELLGKDDDYLPILRVDGLIQEEQFSEAKQLLDSLPNKNDSSWLQMYAYCLLKEDKPHDAIECLLKAAELLPHPEILKSAARIAFEQNLYDVAAEALEKTLATEPENTATLFNLANTCFRKGDFKRAAELFSELARLQPDDSSHRLNRAACLIGMGLRKEALEEYDIVCQMRDAPLRAFLERAHLLGIEDPKTAFDSIKDMREEHWDDPQYVQMYLQLAHPAGQDGLGGQAFQRLWQLQCEGKLEQTILEPKTIDDLLAYKRSFDKRAEEVHEYTVRGKIPWILASEMLGNAPSFEWGVRTQSLPHIPDGLHDRARYSIYSTNGFHPGLGEDGKTRLRPLKCPDRGASVVADLTALITLHRLHLLEQAQNYFGQISIPQIYIPHLMEDAERLQFHQPSYVNSLTSIKGLMDAETIAVLDDPGVPDQRPMPYVNEYTRPNIPQEHFYRIKDLMEALHSGERISDTKRAELERVAHEPSAVDQDHPALMISESVLISLMTLQTLENHDVLKTVVNTFRVYITPDDQRRIASELRAAAFWRETQVWHKDLMERLSSNDRFTKVQLKPSHDATEADAIADVSIVASLLAYQTNTPLLVDDRACQMLARNQSPGNPYAAFGTDCFLVRLAAEGTITEEQTADFVLQLMEWRYRFVIPSKETLKALAVRYKEHPPGKGLRRVALYVHDCLRDPGLFSGMEKTDLPETMATRVFVALLTIVGEFLTDIWQDQDFNEDQATRITEWAIHELAPSYPKTLGVMRRPGREMISKAILGQLLLRAPSIGDAQRANLSIRTVAKALDMEPDMEPVEYLGVITEIINGI